MKDGLQRRMRVAQQFRAMKRGTDAALQVLRCWAVRERVICKMNHDDDGGRGGGSLLDDMFQRLDL